MAMESGVSRYILETFLDHANICHPGKHVNALVSLRQVVLNIEFKFIISFGNLEFNRAQFMEAIILKLNVSHMSRSEMFTSWLHDI